MRTLLAFCLTLALLFGGGAARAEETEANKALVYSIDVGKADAHLIFLGEDAYLIDTGSGMAWGALRAALVQFGVKRLEGVFLSHTDMDHAGCVGLLADSDIEVGAWYAPKFFVGMKLKRHPLVQAADGMEGSVHWLEAGMTVEASGARFCVLAPEVLDPEEENNNSLVLRLETARGTALFTGDMLSDEEARLLASEGSLKCDLLKVAHHGGAKGTSEEFAARCAPRVAVISTSSEERPSTPDEEVVKRLQSVGAEVFVTQEAPGGGVLTELNGDMTSAEYLGASVCSARETRVTIASLDGKADVLALRNDGDEPVSLAGWYVFSDKGNEVYAFPDDAVIASGGEARLGTRSTDAECDFFWDDKNVFADKGDDRVTLFDEFGREISSAE